MQKPKRIRPNATAAPPTLATVTPAICGLVRTGFVAAAAAATAEDDVAAATEVVDELVEDVDVVAGIVFRPTPSDAAFVVREDSIEEVDLGECEVNTVSVAFTVVVPNAALDALGKIDLEGELWKRLLPPERVVLASSVEDGTIGTVAVSVGCVLGLAP